jgi:hypothetical protein
MQQMKQRCFATLLTGVQRAPRFYRQQARLSFSDRPESIADAKQPLEVEWFANSYLNLPITQ